MALFRRRRSPWLNGVVEGEVGLKNENLGSFVDEIVFRESGMEEVSVEEFGEDVNVGVTENAPYHNMADYKMVEKTTDEGIINTSSS